MRENKVPHIILLGNKIDLVQRNQSQVSSEEAMVTKHSQWELICAGMGRGEQCGLYSSEC